MLLEPAPIHPRPRRTRLAAIATTAVVGVALVAVIGAGLLGPRDPSPPSAATVEGSPTTAGTPVSPAPTIDPLAVPAGPTDDPQAAAAGPPARSRFGLDPASIPTVLAAHAATDGDDHAWYVVLGWLSMRPGLSDCRPGPTSSGIACSREGILTADPSPVLRLTDGRPVEIDPTAPHLRPVFPPGVPISPEGTTDPSAAGPDAAVPSRLVVLVGRFGPTSTEGCTLGFLGCSAPFVVDDVY